jgi:hypothetical protein
MRLVVVHPDEQEAVLHVSPGRLEGLKSYLTTEIEDAMSARQMQDQSWTDCLRQYEGVPKNPIRNIPIENAPNLEVTLGAIASDAIYAQLLDVIFNQVSPLVTCRATREDKDLVDDVKHLQRWVDVACDIEWNVRAAADQVALDWCQLGTGVFYVPWVDDVKKTQAYKIRDVGARVLSHPIEDFLVPGGAMDDAQRMPWVALRFWLTDEELELNRLRYGWDTTEFKAVGSIGWMRSRREQLGRTQANRKITNLLYETFDVYCIYDIDGDGIDEDLLVTFDRTGRAIAKLRYCPYDRRPVNPPRYQKRAHLFYALGPLEMIRPYQDELTEIHNDTMTNSRLANTRMWKGRPNAVQGQNLRVWPNRFIPSADPTDFGEVKLSDVYPSAYRNEASVIAYAERRVGVRELSGAPPSKVLGGRTPGITALSMLQQVNQRFAPAFDDFRREMAGAIRQCLWRYRERLLAGDERAAQNIIDILGNQPGTRVIALLMSKRFEESVSVELSATTPQVNRVQERQDVIQLLTAVIGPYYEKTMQLMEMASSPQASPAIRKTAEEIAEKIGEAVERAIRTYDSIRDPKTFILELDEAIAALAPPDTGLQGLAAILGGGAGNGPQPPLPLPGPGTVQ